MELTVVNFIQYIVHYVADIIHNFPHFLPLFDWATNSITDFLGFFPPELASVSFFGISACFLVRLVKF